MSGNYPTGSGRPIEYHAATVGAEIVVLARIPVPIDRNLSLNSVVFATRTDTPGTARSWGIVQRWNRIGGTVSLTADDGSGDALQGDASILAYHVDLAGSGGDVVISVTGVVNTSISWTMPSYAIAVV